MRQIKTFLTLLFFTSITANATTWDEPWADKVIKESSTFLLATIIKSDPQLGVDIKVIKIISGKPVPETFRITAFSLLDLCSSSGKGPEFHFEETDSCYFFVSQNTKGEYCIATPTTGYDYVIEGNVAATFRHSYHQASVPLPIYELAMTAIFKNYHSQPFDRSAMVSVVNKYLNYKPAGFREAELGTFFLQHVALESVYHLKLDINENLLLPFLKDTANFHNQVSAARAYGAKITDQTKTALLMALEDPKKRNFVKVLCVWTLMSMNPTELKDKLSRLAQNASDEEDDFGGNIMDHRVCTRIPTLKEALNTLIAKL